MNALVEWLGEGGSPVDRFRAESRAFVCEYCPENKRDLGKWWETAKHHVANAIRATLSIAHELDLHLPNDDSLFMCKQCGCCTRLKVWTPIDHIRHTTPIEKISTYPKSCWIIKELNHHPRIRHELQNA